MSLITEQDLIMRFGETEIAELSDHENHAVINSVVVATAIADAAAEVMPYLQAAGIASIMLVNPHQSLQLKTCDIARYYLHEDGATGIVEQRYTQALAWLKSVMRNPSMLVARQPANDAANGVSSHIAVKPNTTPTWGDS